MTQTLNYREVKAVSNSILSEFEKDFRAFRNWWLYSKPFDVKDSISLTIGSIVDTLLTREEDFENFYIIDEGYNISPQMTKFCNHFLDLLKLVPDNTIPNREELLLKAYELTGLVS